MSLSIQARSASDSGTGLTAILKPARPVARKTPSMALTRRSKGMPPIPLPMSTIADDLSAALGSVMSVALTEPTWTNRTGGGLGADLGAGDDEPLGALPP